MTDFPPVDEITALKGRKAGSVLKGRGDKPAGVTGPAEAVIRVQAGEDRVVEVSHLGVVADQSRMVRSRPKTSWPGFSAILRP